eukprot:1140788-Rhodomonas_salina.1
MAVLSRVHAGLASTSTRADRERPRAGPWRVRLKASKVRKTQAEAERAARLRKAKVRTLAHKPNTLSLYSDSHPHHAGVPTPGPA